MPVDANKAGRLHHHAGGGGRGGCSKALKGKEDTTQLYQNKETKREAVTTHLVGALGGVHSRHGSGVLLPFFAVLNHGVADKHQVGAEQRHAHVHQAKKEHQRPLESGLRNIFFERISMSKHHCSVK